MRYTIWGPVLGLVIAAVLFLMGVFGLDANKPLITAVILVIIGLAGGWYLDSRAK